MASSEPQPAPKGNGAGLMGLVVVLAMMFGIPTAAAWWPELTASIRNHGANDECRRQRDIADAARTRFEAYDASVAPDLLPPNPDGKVLFVKQWVWSQPKLLPDGQFSFVEKPGQMWSDYDGLWTTRDGSLPTDTWQDPGDTAAILRARPATEGDRHKNELRLGSQGAQTAWGACVEHACEPLTQALAKAKRLHELHSSDAAARELVNAEEAVEDCRRTDEGGKR